MDDVLYMIHVTHKVNIMGYSAAGDLCHQTLSKKYRK